MSEKARKEFAKRIKRLREDRGMTQADLAERLGYTKQAISNWERGLNAPSIDDLEALAIVFNIEVGLLFNGSNDEKRERCLLVLKEIIPIPNKINVYAMFLEDRYYDLWIATLYDADYRISLMGPTTCSIHNRYDSFRDDFLKDAEDGMSAIRDELDRDQISEFGTANRGTREMIEIMEQIADDPNYLSDEE